MGERVYKATVARVLDAPRIVVWGLVADTDRGDRAVGLKPGEYRWEEVDGRWVRTARATELGMDIEWVEPPYEWLEGRFVEGYRTFRAGPASRGGMNARLEDAGEGRTRVEATFWAAGDRLVMRMIGPVLRAKFKRGAEAYFDSIERMLSKVEAEIARDAEEPAVARARRVLMTGFDETANGPRTEPNRALLEQRGRRLRGAGIDAEVADAIVRYLDERPDEDVTQIRPFELARAWGLDRRQVLRGFLHAVQCGLMDLQWQISCPVCRVAASTVGSLEEVNTGVHCEACRIDYDVDFSKHVEAVFQSNPAIRQVTPTVYCAASPGFRPHVLGQLRLGPGERREEPVELPEGELHLRSLYGSQRADVEVEPRGTLQITLRDDAIETRFEPGGDAGRIVVESSASEEVVLLLERSGWSADAVLGSVITSFPEFVDLFATEAPAAGVELTVSSIGLVFTDLTGSTAMYQREGDAKAFAAVQEHFRVLEAVVAEHEGAIVKTMGDAIMASFASPVQAVRAALAMVPAHDARFAEQGLGLKVGVHAGPCLAVRANDRLDYFGTTVNMAARLEGQARSGHVVLTESLASEPPIASLLEGRGREGLETDLKGIREAQRLVRVDARDSRAPTPASQAEAS